MMALKLVDVVDKNGRGHLFFTCFVYGLSRALLCKFLDMSELRKLVIFVIALLTSQLASNHLLWYIGNTLSRFLN